MKSTTIIPEFVDVIPDNLDGHKLYISERYKTAIHRCCCGCGEEVVTPLTPADWSVRRHKETVSMAPSIGNWSFACKSHYWIRHNQVVWAGSMTEQEIKKVRARDIADKEVYISAVNRQKQQEAWPYSWFSFIWRSVKRLWPF
jgi:heterodisulfide reductase subunit B